jgi:hypothetical protein
MRVVLLVLCLICTMYPITGVQGSCILGGNLYRGGAMMARFSLVICS